VYSVSPARFINSDIYNKFGPDTVVFPVCKPVYKKDKLMDITYSFHTFTLDDHPFIRDMYLLLEALRETTAVLQQGEDADSISTYLIRIFYDVEKFSDLTFYERPYAATLGDVCERLSLIAFSKSDCGVTYNKKRIEAFSAMSKRDQLERVVKVLVERFVDCFEFLSQQDKKPDAADVLAALRKGQCLEDFLDALFDDLLTDLSGYVNTLLEDVLEDIEDFDDLFEALDEESSIEMLEAPEVQEIQIISSFCCSHFFTVFGQYLQLIQPEHDDAFAFMHCDDAFLNAMEMEGLEEDEDTAFQKGFLGALLYHIAPEGYCLTALGAARAKKDISKSKNQFFPLVLPEEYQETFEGMLEDDDGEYPDDFFDDLFGDLDEMDNELSLFADMMSNNILELHPHKERDPLEGLNPDNLPVFTDKDATYIFKVKRRVIVLEGTKTLEDLCVHIRWEFDLNEERMSSFFMGKKFHEGAREIRCSRFNFFDEDIGDAEKYSIHELGLYKGQKFLYLHNFMNENRFTITFAGVE
jgi:hypothetical protein